MKNILSKVLTSLIKLSALPTIGLMTIGAKFDLLKGDAFVVEVKDAQEIIIDDVENIEDVINKINSERRVH